ncbi:MAG: hypothetical protein ACE1S7_06760 [Candidatus Tisiphia sp.]
MQAQAENILRLNLGNAADDTSSNLGNAFKYKNKLIADYEEHRLAIENFLHNYYKKRYYQTLWRFWEHLLLITGYFRTFMLS